MSTDVQTSAVASSGGLRPYGAWIVAGVIAVAGVAGAGTLAWRSAHSDENNAAQVPIQDSLGSKEAVVNDRNAHKSGTSTAQRAPARAGAATAAAACAECGVVESVEAVQQKGQATGVGAVVGGVAGAVVGNQMGGGNGKTAMTLLGAVGGGLAGNEIEKRSHSTTVYHVHLRMDDGTTRTITQSTNPPVGERVRVEGGKLVALPAKG